MSSDRSSFHLPFQDTHASDTDAVVEDEYEDLQKNCDAQEIEAEDETQNADPSLLRPTMKGLRLAHERMQREIRLEHREIVEKFVHGWGPGGQKINKTSSAVFIKDVATGITIKAQPTRVQSQNRKIAKKLLQLKIDATLHPQDSVLALKRTRERRRKDRQLRRWTPTSEDGIPKSLL